MISSKDLIKIVKKWERLAPLRTKRISWAKTKGDVCSTSSRTDKGHFVAYSSDKRRFMIPLVYLKNDIFRELLEAAQEEFGLPRDGPIMLPCDAIFMEYALSLIQMNVAADLHKAVLMSISNGHCTASSELPHDQSNYQSPICSF